MSNHLVIVSAAATHCSERSRARRWWWQKTEETMASNTRARCRTALSPSRFGWFFTLVCLVCPLDAVAGYSSLYIFGDSLSDAGNNAVVLAPNVTPTPISGNSFIPTYPYASGRYTNDQVWAQTLASSLGLNANPSLLGELTTPLAERRPGCSLRMPFLADCSTLFLRASKPKQHPFCSNTMTQHRAMRST